MDHSLHPMSHEHLFEVANALLTVPKAFGSFAGNPTITTIRTTEEVKGSLSTHRKSCDNDDIDT
jgi:hypothetical protein